MAVARERPCKYHVRAGYRCDKGKTTIEELFGGVRSMRSASKFTSYYKKETAIRDDCSAVSAESIKRTICHYESVLSRRLGCVVIVPQGREK
jgi:hypothetical protein